MADAERVLVIIPAAGSGTRFGGDMPKQFLPLGGKPLVQRVVERFLFDAIVDARRSCRCRDAASTP